MNGASPRRGNRRQWGESEKNGVYKQSRLVYFPSFAFIISQRICSRCGHELQGFNPRRSSCDKECRVVCARTLALASARLDERTPNHNARRTERRTRRAASASRAGCASEHLSRCSRSLSDADPAAAASSWMCGWTCGSRVSHSAPSCCRAALTEAIACAASNSPIQAVTQQRGQTRLSARRPWCAQLTCRISRYLRFGHYQKKVRSRTKLGTLC